MTHKPQHDPTSPSPADANPDTDRVEPRESGDELGAGHPSPNVVQAQELVIAEGWCEAGKIGIRLGPDVFMDQQWTPILFDGDDDPTFHKSAGLRTLTSGEVTLRRRILELESRILELENLDTRCARCGWRA